MYGKKSMGIIRSTFLINKDGKLIKKWSNVRAKGHAEKVVNELQKIQVLIFIGNSLILLANFEIDLSKNQAKPVWISSLNGLSQRSSR